MNDVATNDIVTSGLDLTTGRTVWLEGTIDNTWLDFMKMIVEWNKEDIGVPVEEREPIYLYFYSEGGDLDVTWAIISTIEASVTPVYAVNMGQCYSGACFIYLACHKRYAMKHSKFLIHKGQCSDLSGTYDQIMNELEEYRRDIQDIYDYILQRTLITEDCLNEKSGKDWYLSADTAYKYEVCHKLVNNFNDIMQDVS